MIIGGGKPKYMRDLMPFGQKGIVTYRKGTNKTKIENKGRECMFVGIMTGGPGQTYRMYDPKTKTVVKSRDVIWTKKMMFGTNELKRVAEKVQVDHDDEDDDDQIKVNEDKESDQVPIIGNQEVRNLIDGWTPQREIEAREGVGNQRMTRSAYQEAAEQANLIADSEMMLDIQEAEDMEYDV